MTVAAAGINYNGGRTLDACLGSLFAQTLPPEDVLVVDNHSTDDSCDVLRRWLSKVRVLELPRNVGFAGAANVSIRQTRSPYVLLLNPDIVLGPTYIQTLTDVAEAHSDIGSLTGKLLRPSSSKGSPVIDSAGHLLYRNRWAVNRGEGEPDLGQYDRPEEVFGVCAAAALYRRAMLDDVRVDGEVFAESFFFYLEDVDLDWRARLRGWRAYYVPSAVAYHERGYKGGYRRRDPAILRHSLKNRYLMMIRNDSLADLLADAWVIVPMELLRFLDFLLTAPASLVGYLDAVRLLRSTWRQRRAIRGRLRVPRRAIRQWLRRYPYRGEIAERMRLFLARPRLLCA